MHSQLLIEYMRTGMLPPFIRGDSKEKVVSILGIPEDWKERVIGIGWKGAALSNFRDSWAWHCGSLCVGFAESATAELEDITLNYGFGKPTSPIRFPAPYAELPTVPFALGELLRAMTAHGVKHRHDHAGLWISEGNVAACTLDPGDFLSDDVVSLYPHSFIESKDSREYQAKLRLIQAYAELLQSPHLPPEERVNFERQLKTMKNQLE